MLVLMVEPVKAPYPAQVEASLEGMQRAVGGLIQVLYPFEDPMALVCNDEGKLLGLPANRGLRDDAGNLYDIVCGTFFLCGITPDSGAFRDLTEEELAVCGAQFRWPEVFLRLGGSLLCLPVEEA